MSTIKLPTLNDREATILTSIIEEYIDSGTPVSSGYIKKYCGLNLSPATIRAVMASLEQKGLLTHFHTSGGRVPTDVGYRFYVNDTHEIIASYDPFSDNIKNELLTIVNDIDELLNATVLMLSKVSRMFGVISVSGYQRSILTDIELVLLEGNRVMLVLALDTGLVKSIVLNLDLVIQPNLVTKITQVLKDRLIGYSLKEIQSTIRVRLNDLEMYSHELVQVLVNDSEKYFDLNKNESIYTSSYDILLEQPEFQNLTSFQRLLPALDKAYLNQHFQENFNAHSSHTLIGTENEDELLNECSIIRTEFNSEIIKGRIGVLGPKRIPYLTVQSIIEKFAEIIQHAL